MNLSMYQNKRMDKEMQRNFTCELLKIFCGYLGNGIFYNKIVLINHIS